jgi:hypothetical protein
MAKKRALVDGAIALARCSDMFTQDVEDYSDAEVVVREPAGAATAALKAKVMQIVDVPSAAPKSAGPPPSEAMSFEEPPPPGDDDAPPGMRADTTPAAPLEVVRVPFGKNKGKPVNDASDRDLDFLERYAAEALEDPDKQKYAAGNTRLLEAVRAEKARR